MDPTLTPSPTPSPAPTPAPADPSVTPPPAAVTRPDYVPETYWDPAANALKPEVADVFKFKSDYDTQQAALAARTPDDIKIEVKLPDTVKVPEGFEVKVDEKDPRIPVIREMAVKHGWTQDTVDALVALDAQQKIEAHTVEMARVAAEDKSLGDNGKARKDAVGNWAKGLLDRKEISEAEYQEIRTTAAFAAGVTLLEKIMAKVSGTPPGGSGNLPAPPKPSEVPITQRWYGASPQQKAS